MNSYGEYVGNLLIGTVLPEVLKLMQINLKCWCAFHIVRSWFTRPTYENWVVKENLQRFWLPDHSLYGLKVDTIRCKCWQAYVITINNNLNLCWLIYVCHCLPWFQGSRDGTNNIWTFKTKSFYTTSMCEKCYPILRQASIDIAILIEKLQFFVG